MPIRLTQFEKRVAKQLAEIKTKSGSHSPSPAMFAGVKGVEVKHDFCYIANPHATELFLKYAKEDFKIGSKLRRIVADYPSQNRALAEKLERVTGVSARNIFVGNGATEVIQAVLQTFAKKKVLVPVPTFSPYLEFAPKGVKTVLHQLRKEAGFRLEPERFPADVRKEKPDTVVLINPNNPDGGFVSAHELHLLLKRLRSVETVIVDESFIHFVQADARTSGVHSFCRHLMSTEFPNLVIIKSFSKDFGIAGLRLGYAVMSAKRVSELLERGYLWNVSGFGEYFLDLLTRKDFLREYEQARQKAIGEHDDFFGELSKIEGMQVYPSKTNSFLVELLEGSTANDLMVRLLKKHGIYIRSCGDKVGLTGEFIRVASRTMNENRKLVRVLKEVLSE